MASPLFLNVGTASQPTPSSKTLTGVVPHYQVSLDVRGDETVGSSGKKIFPIIANLPERFNMEFSSQWDAPIARASAGDIASAATGGAVSAATINAGLSGSGVGKATRAQSFQVWESSSSMKFNIELVFRALTNSQTDVREKHIALLKLTAPSEGPGGILLPPGPNIREQIIDGPTSRIITMYLGRYLKLENVIIDSVSSDIACLFDKDGIPQSMTISIGVSSFYTSFTTTDIDRMFTV